MIKVRGSYARIEILFWDVLFWLMKGLQHLRDGWITFTQYIQPSLKIHIALLFCVCTIGLGVGFVIGYVKVHLLGW